MKTVSEIRIELLQLQRKYSTASLDGQPLIEAKVIELANAIEKENRDNRKTQEILSNNALIAEFMGMPESNNGLFSNVSKTYRPSELKYHESWDWLMPVVEKIESVIPDDSVVTIANNDCTIPFLADEFDIEITGTSKIDAVYKAVVLAIKWYNTYPVPATKSIANKQTK
jgi:hypothetical protein